MPDGISAVFLKTRFIAMAIIFLLVLAVLAVPGCGNRGPLYLRDAESERAPAGQEQKQKVDVPDKKKKPTTTKDK
ncbi:MAG: lipoprotein [Acidiferrobacterales bacterium]